VRTVSAATVQPAPRVDVVDPRALLEEAYAAHRPALFRYVLAMTRDPGDAEELVQETFLRLTLEIRHGRAPDRCDAWLFRVAGNLARSRFRRARVRDLHRPAPPDGAAGLDPADVALRRERVVVLEQAMAGLAGERRMALVLAAHGYSGAEIASRIGRTDLATRALLLRARRQVRACPDLLDLSRHDLG